eukprot:1285510-Amphidinium_carterae.1
MKAPGQWGTRRRKKVCCLRCPLQNCELIDTSSSLHGKHPKCELLFCQLLFTGSQTGSSEPKEQNATKKYKM